MRYRHAWPGVLLLATLVVALGSVLFWGDHFLSPGPSGGLRRLLELRLLSRPPQEVPRLVDPQPAVAAAPERAAPPTPAADPPEPSPPSPSAVPPEESPAPSPAPAPEPPRRPAPPQVRYALDLGTFAIPEDAERVESQLNQAGFSTVRFRQQASVRLFSVFVRALADAWEGQAVVERLRQEGFSRAVVLGGSDGVAVRVAQAMPLRLAVKVAERLRAAGHEARVAVDAATAEQVTLRHGNFSSRREAEAVSQEVSWLGVPNEVVQVR